MLSDESLEAIAEKIPARLAYAVMTSWKEQEEDAGSWDDSFEASALHTLTEN